MRDISGAEFRFAKTLTLPFFGSGIVDLPPGGAKRSKNSRKMQMVFFVFYGRVTVEVGTPVTRFGIGKGGQWQVPRGMSQTIFYSFPCTFDWVASQRSEVIVLQHLVYAKCVAVVAIRCDVAPYKAGEPRSLIILLSLPS